MYFKIEKSNGEYQVSNRSIGQADWDDYGSLQDWLPHVGYIRESTDDILTVFHRLDDDHVGKERMRPEDYTKGIRYTYLKQEADNLKEISNFYTQTGLKDLAPIMDLVPKGLTGRIKHFFTSRAKKDEQHRKVMEQIDLNQHNSATEYVQTSTEHDTNILVNGKAIESIEDKGAYRIISLSKEFAPYGNIKTRMTIDDLLDTFDNLTPDIVSTQNTTHRHTSPALGQKLNKKPGL